MSQAAEIIRQARDIRLRLRRPPNAILDTGIDLRRHLKVPTPVPPPPMPRIRARVHISEIVKEGKKIKIDMILRAVSDGYLVGIVDLKSPSRRPAVAFPRHIVVYLACKYTKLSCAGIGRMLKRDHTTILYARDRITQLMSEPLFNHETAKKVFAIEEALFAGDYD